jgi:hypothetical protein
MTNLDKVRSALAQMDDAYWDKVSDTAREYDKRVRMSLGGIYNRSTALMVAQVNVLNARYNGYRQLVGDTSENDKLTTDKSEVVKDSKDAIEGFVEKKRQIVNDLVILLDELIAVLEEEKILGEMWREPPEITKDEN